MHRRRARAVLLAAALGLAGATRSTSAAVDDASLEKALERGERAAIEEATREARAAEAPGPRDAYLIGWVAAWEIAGDQGAAALARYRALAAAPGDPDLEMLERICERALRLALLDPDTIKRSLAVEEMEATKLERFAGALDLAMERDTSDPVRNSAAHALRRIGGRRVRAILRANLDHQDPAVRRLAADVLARMNDNTALRFLRKQARTGTRDDKLWATEMLGRLGDRSAFPVLDTLIGDHEAWYRAKVVAILDTYDDSRTAPILRKGLADSSDEVRILAASALADIGDASGLPVLREFTQSQAATQRVRAYQKLAELDDRTAIPLIREGMKSDSELVRDQAGVALAKLGDPEGRAYVATKQGALGSFGALAGALLAGRRAAPDEAPPPPPETVVEDREVDRYERAQSIRALGEMGSAGLAGLRTGLADPDGLVRQTAARALARSGTREDVTRLAELLADADPKVRFAGAGAIVTILAR